MSSSPVGSPSIPTKTAKLGIDFTPNNYTVLCGRGKDCYNSIGNRRFRIIVENYLERYSNATTKSQKSQVVSEVFDVIKHSGGRFVKCENGIYYELGETAAREKVGAQFRDCLPLEYRSATKTKTLLRSARKEKSKRCLISSPEVFCSGDHEDDASSFNAEPCFSSHSLPFRGGCC